MATIEIDRVCKSYGAVQALNEVSLSVEPGEIYGLIGPDGAGKTTLFRILVTLLVPDRGSARIEGYDVVRDYRTIRSRIGYMPEERGLYKNLTVMDQAMYLAQLKGLSAHQAKLRIRKWLAKFGIENWADKKIQELSKGMAQKVQFIVNVLHEPEVMILDEPFSGFDPINAEMIRAEIEQMCKNGTTILFSTHRMESVEQMCSHILLIDKGRGILSGELTRIKERYRQGVYKVDIDIRAEQRSALEALPEFIGWEDDPRTIKPQALFRLKDLDNPNALLSTLASMGQIHSFAEQLPSVSDIFFQAVEGGAGSLTSAGGAA